MLWRKKSFSVNKRSHSALASLRHPTGSRSAKRKQWSKENIAAALKSVEQGSSVTTASRNFGVPRSTFYDQVSGRVIHGVKPGSEPYLDDTEELELSSYLNHWPRWCMARHEGICSV